jgi:hypothetical protein
MLKCSHPDCTNDATYFWEGRWLCYGHAVDKREALLRDLQKRFMQQANDIWQAFYNSREPEGEVDSQDKQV